jgi:glycosyltransferase involved in cell wall biosynthesis
VKRPVAELPALAYFVSEYPSRSHTFIRREIAALRARGVSISTFANRRSGSILDALDRAAHQETRSLLPVDPRLYLRAHLARAAADPAAYGRVLRDATRHRVPGARAFVWSLFHFAEAIVLAEHLERRGVRHVHCHFANSGASVVRLAARHLGITYSLTLHGISDFDFPAGILLPEKLRECAFAVCISHFGRAQALRQLERIHWDKVEVVRCGVEAASVGGRVARGDGRVRVLCVGRLSSEKGQEGLIEAAARAFPEDPRLELVLVGDGPLRHRLEAAAARTAVHDRIHFRGALPEGETLREIASADILALPSFMEGIPLVLMEAMGSGVPVVAPRVAGIPELVEHGQSGLLFTPACWDELGDQLLLLARDPDAREQLGAAGRRRVAGEFVVERSAERLEAIFRARIPG